jgi:hypothetical protein
MFGTNCRVKVLKKIFFKRIEIVKQEDKNKLGFFSDLTLYSIWLIDETQMTFKAAFTLEIKWLDTRLTFINLKHNNSQVFSNQNS